MIRPVFGHTAQRIGVSSKGTLVRITRNVSVYGIGIAIATVGALMFIDIISGPILAAAGLFGLGLGIVLFVHERLEGPI